MNDLLSKPIMDCQNSDLIIMFAFRYSLGRQTYAVDLMVDTLKELWNKLKEHTKKQIKIEIIYAIKAGNAGNVNVDVPQWKTILELDN